MTIYHHNNLFLDNKYTRWYYNIIIKAQSLNRVKLKQDNPNYIYYENHHILPRCMFPEYSKLSEHKWNGVLLTPKEHFICHALLCKMVEGSNKGKLSFAFKRLFSGNKHQERYTSKLHNNIKIVFSHTKETKIRIANKLKGKIFTDKHKENISKSKRGMKHSTEYKLKMTGRKLSEETKQKIREARKHQIFTEETREKLSRSAKIRMNNLSEEDKEIIKNRFGRANKGRRHTQETRDNQSNRTKGIPKPYRKGKVCCRDSNNVVIFLTKEEYNVRKNIDVWAACSKRFRHVRDPIETKTSSETLLALPPRTGVNVAPDPPPEIATVVFDEFLNPEPFERLIREVITPDPFVLTFAVALTVPPETVTTPVLTYPVPPEVIVILITGPEPSLLRIQPV